MQCKWQNLNKWSLGSFSSGFAGSSSEDVIKFLEKKDPCWIVESLSDLYLPVFDGHFFHGDPATLYKSGDYYKVPSMMGFNSDEGAFFPLLCPDGGKVTSIAEAKMKVKSTIERHYEGFRNIEEVHCLETRRSNSAFQSYYRFIFYKFCFLTTKISLIWTNNRSEQIYFNLRTNSTSKAHFWCFSLSKIGGSTFALPRIANHYLENHNHNIWVQRQE